MRVIVTGAAGFIGSNIVKGLNKIGVDDIIAVDNLKDGSKFVNMLDCDIVDYLDQSEFYLRFRDGAFGKVEAVFHEGACSDTMEQDGQFMMANNFRCSMDLLESCNVQKARLLYASSAATYGDGTVFLEKPEHERPKNVYGYSKLLFDQVVRRNMEKLATQVAGFRYFNVFGPGEQHKGRMASVAFHHFNQLRDRDYVELFGAYDGYEAGEQKRDFVFVDDVVSVNLWFFENPDASGIFNLGTGKARDFNSVAAAVLNAHSPVQNDNSLEAFVSGGKIRYIDFPDALKGKYQSFTQADLTNLRKIGCMHEFKSLEEGIGQYVEWLQDNTPPSV